MHVWTYPSWFVREREPIKYQTYPAYALKAVAFKPIPHKESHDAAEAARRAGYAQCFPISMANEIAIGGESDQIQLFSTYKRTVIATYLLPPSTMVTCLHWSPDLKYLAAGGYNSNEHKGVIRVWEVQTGVEACTYWQHPQTVNALAWSPDSTRIASGSDDTTVQVWDVRTGDRTLTYRGHTHPVTAVCWDKPHHYSEYCFPSEQILSGSRDHTVQAWHSRTGRRKFTHRHHQAVASVCWNGNYISSGSEDGTIDLYIGSLSLLWNILYSLIYGKER
ncbi:WD40 repeat domain-containing protein [Ktedonospora formicarum]|uniref:Uncharacterized protein n=1 Tax=Ktedonospora formicarum TaxID=2778364 RepID=A0A8J3ICT4_9CHLR|nr:hypothetical protein [Ktedonospora formicarum]GHO50362.1 hypothetical protein KSX_85250 [Ktedonospora formicarum]